MEKSGQNIEYSLRIARIICESLSGTISVEDQQVLDTWLAENEKHRQMFEEFGETGFPENREMVHSMFEVEKGYQKFLRGKQQIRHKRKLYRWTAVAAAVFLAVGVAVSLLIRQPDPSIPEKLTEITGPGKSVATLTLANGEKISLADTINKKLDEPYAKVNICGNLLDYSAEDSVAALVYHTMTTPKGGEYQLVLGDGTRVWLNAQSELKYPVAFIGGSREVLLSGEAYFDVAPDSRHPFIVKTDIMDIRVLGTSFNVSAYPEEKARTTLVEGKVMVRVGREDRQLVPGEQLSCNRNGDIEVRQVDTEAYIAWKNQRFVFEDDLLEEVLHKLGRWYNVEFFIQNSSVRELRFTGDLPKYEDLGKVLEKLEQTTYIRFVQNGNTVIVQQEK